MFRKAVLALLAIIMVLSTAACSSSATPVANAPKEPVYLKVGRELDSAPNLDAITSTYNIVFEISNSVFNQLVQPDPVTLELKPVLIEDFPEVSEDGKLFTFHLKKGVKFHNGQELTSKDVEYTFWRFFAPEWNNLNTWMADFIKGAEELMNGEADTLSGFTVVDDYTFTIELNMGYTAFIAVLAVPPLAIVPKEACEAAGERWGIDTYIGTGQYKVKSFKPQEELILERNDDYFGEKAKLDGIQWIHMLPETQLIEWEAGTIDVCGVDVALVDHYYENFPDNVREQTYIGTHWLSFNQEMKPLDDKRVREAIGLATDIKSLCDNYFKGHVKPAKSLLPEGMAGFDASLPDMEYNPEKAKQLLAEAGYPNGIEISCTVRETSSWVEIYQILQEQYKLANITLNIEKVDAAGWFDKRSTGNVQFYMMNWYADFLDPDNMTYGLYHSSVADFFSSGNKDPYFDGLLEQGRVLSIEEKQDFYAKLEHYLSREKIAIWPLYTPTGYILVNDRVKDVFIKKDFLYTFEIGYIVEK